MVKRQAGVPGFNTYMYYVPAHAVSYCKTIFTSSTWWAFYVFSGWTDFIHDPTSRTRLFLLLKATYAVLKSSPWCISSTSVGYTQRLAKINRSFNFSIFTGLL